MSYNDFRQHARADLARMMMLQSEVRNRMVVSQADVEAYFKEHQDEFGVTKERFKLAQILIAVPEKASPQQVAAAQTKAGNIHDEAVKGKDFGELARKYSDDDSKDKYGELGWFSPGDILPAIENAIAKLDSGQISQVVKTDFGFHIIKVEVHERPGPASLTPDIAAAIRNKLSTEKAKSHFQEWVENDLVKEHHIEAFY